jgi:hypothetical protein
MQVILELTEQLSERLWGHLLQNDIEQVAILFATVNNRPELMLFTAADAYLAPPEDFAFQNEYHVELADHVRPSLIKQAWDSGTALVEFHSHPGDRHKVMFSPSDLAGFAEFVPHCRWRLRGRPYLAVVVGRRSIDALAWVDSAPGPVALDTVRVDGGMPIIPTQRTINQLTTKEATDGY